MNARTVRCLRVTITATEIGATPLPRLPAGHWQWSRPGARRTIAIPRARQRDTGRIARQEVASPDDGDDDDEVFEQDGTRGVPDCLPQLVLVARGLP